LEGDVNEFFDILSS